VLFLSITVHNDFEFAASILRRDTKDI